MSARHRLLVIDYEPRSLERTLALLKGTGFAVSGAGNAREINAALNRAAPDAVIVEPMIPGQDGFKLIQVIKRLRPERPTFVIAASRIYRGPRFHGMAKEAGADLFVERPSQDDRIVPALTRALGEQPEPTAPVPPEEVSAADTPAPAAAEAPGPATSSPPRPGHTPSPPAPETPLPSPGRRPRCRGPRSRRREGPCWRALPSARPRPGPVRASRHRFPSCSRATRRSTPPSIGCSGRSAPPLRSRGLRPRR